eukprot:TRINITY_DN6326_c0_g1_i1.p1 TRINITY_DN6326_c0_g1~~TRINITY_DN6326_c0_g1_i1.p1  ORF type:complete len:642 (-),score=188.55 TRINITY_DN6326_c0_g1_i1:438-2321(-)
MPVPTGPGVVGRVLHCVTLPVHIASPDGLSWSSDSQLAVATKKGVYVFQIVPDARKLGQKVNFVKTFVENDTEVNPWQMESVVPEELLSQLPREVRNSVIMDRVMAPHMVGGENIFRQASKVGWTPEVDSGDGNCLLITLTVDHRLRFYKQDGRQWNTEEEVSQVLLDYLKSKPVEDLHVKTPNQSENEATVKNLKSRCYSLATKCWCWKGQGEFFTGQLSGHVVYWEWERNVVVKNVFKTELEEISCVHWDKVDNLDILFVAGLDGRVLALRVGRNFSVLGWVWDDLDRLPVNKIKIIKDEAKYQIVLAKANFCISMKIKVNKSKIEVAKPQNLNTGLTRIVGMETYQDRMMLSNQKSNIKLWDMKKSSSVIELDVAREHYFCYGVAGSNNQSIFACLENISSFNDHLIMREPGRLVLWTLETQENLRRKMLKGVFGPDLMEAYRLLLTANKTEFDPAIELSTDPIQCKLDWWHHSVLLARASQTSQYLVQLKRVVEHCEVVLRSQAAKVVLTSPQGLYDIPAKQASAHFVITFSSISSLARLGTSTLASVTETPWTCRICGSLARDQPAHVSHVTCTAGHAWPRCVTTQQPVMVTCPAKCSWCKGVAVKTMARTCCLCQGPLLQS